MVDFSPLRGKSAWISFHDAVKGPADTAGKLLEMDNIGKSLLSVFKVFDLAYMPNLPPFFQKLASDNKVCIDVIASFKVVFTLKKITTCDVVGRTYWETHKVTEIVDVVFTLGSNLIGTVRYVSRLASIALPASLTLWKMGFTCVSYTCRGYNDNQNIIKFKKELAVLSARKADSDGKIRSLSDQEFKDKYHLKRDICGKKIALLNRKIERLCQNPPKNELAARRERAFNCHKLIEKWELKFNRYEKYLCALDFDPIDRFCALKKEKWVNRIKKCNNNLTDKLYSRAFHLTFAATLALGILASLLAVQHVVITSVLTGMGVVVSAIGMKWLIDQPTEKAYKII